MSENQGTTRAQAKFLRSFRTEPFGPRVRDWPSPAVLRRWLRKPGFVAAMRGVREAIRYQSDFQLLASAGVATHLMHTTVTSGDEESQKAQISAMSTLVKLLHIRERFLPPEPPKPINLDVVSTMLAQSHPDCPVKVIRENLRLYCGIDVKAILLESQAAERKNAAPRSTAMLQAQMNVNEDSDDAGHDSA